MQFVAGAVAVSILRELGPLLTAIVVIGRSGSAFAAEIGTKKVTEEVDALRTMALDPVAFLVAPKFLAMLVMVPCLTIWADFMGIVGGSVFGVAGAGFTFGSYFQATRDSIVLRDIYTGLIKSALFGSCNYGCRMQGRLLHRRGRRGSWALDHGGCRYFDRTRDCGRSGFHGIVLFHQPDVTPELRGTSVPFPCLNSGPFAGGIGPADRATVRRCSEMNDGGSNEAAISVVNLRVSYGDREILHGITFDVRVGEKPW
jgi:hypothetical protein